MSLPAARQLADTLEQAKPISMVPAWPSRWTRWNTEGRSIKRHDLPKIEVTRYWQAPNFGRPDKHDVFQARQVWQRQLLHGGSMEVSFKVVAAPGHRYTVTLEADHLFDIETADDDPDLLMAVSLVSEGIRSTAVPRPSEMTRDEWEAAQRVEWVFLDGGTPSDTVFDRAIDLGSGADRSTRDVMIERIEAIRTTQPGGIVIGSSGLSRYVGFKYADDLVALENFTYGNALYLMYEDWEALSRRSRRDLLARPAGGFDRIVHAGKWRDVFLRLLRVAGHQIDATDVAAP